MAEMSRGKPGHLAASTPSTRIVPGISEVDAHLSLGIAVTFGSAESTFALPEKDDAIYGLTLYDSTARTEKMPGDTAIDPRSRTAILRRGVIWVLPETDVHAGDPAYVRHTTKEDLLQGGLGAAAAGGQAYPVDGLRWLSTAAAGTLAKLDVNLA